MDHPRFRYDLEHCSIRRALDVLGEKWTLLVLREAIYGIRRFDDFARALGCGRGVLSARLKTLIKEDVLTRRDYVEPGQRRRTEYLLTDKGRDLFPAILALSQWSERWTPPPGGPVSSVTDRGSGRPVVVVMTSDPGGERLRMHDIKIAPGPGAKLISPVRRTKRTSAGPSAP
jgi:DNA-binding HxlR family transcriptional regulator